MVIGWGVRAEVASRAAVAEARFSVIKLKRLDENAVVSFRERPRAANAYFLTNVHVHSLLFVVTELE